jgi:hypothetical protein
MAWKNAPLSQVPFHSDRCPCPGDRLGAGRGTHHGLTTGTARCHHMMVAGQGINQRGTHGRFSHGAMFASVINVTLLGQQYIAEGQLVGRDKVFAISKTAILGRTVGMNVTFVIEAYRERFTTYNMKNRGLIVNNKFDLLKVLCLFGHTIQTKLFNLVLVPNQTVQPLHH